MQKLTVLLYPLLFAAAAWCQPAGGFGRGGMMRSPAFLALDVDKDGIISAAELANAPASLKVLDKNGDGKLTEDEVRPQMGGRGGRGGGRGDEPGETQPPSADELIKSLMAFDKNGDGQLTRDELPERMQGLFDRADADKNGILTADEIRKSAQAAATPSGAGRGEGREGRGGREGGRGEAPNFMRLDPILAALDANSDGEISAAEIAAAPTSLKSLDKNGDGQLSEDEVRMNFGPGRGRGPG
jgi:Ca2+-binding EF-hand superfamily protein